MRGKKLSIGLRATLAIFTVTLLVTGTSAVAQTETALHSFDDNGKDGFFPYAGLNSDGVGNLYGTTCDGGAHYVGTAFELTPTAGGSWRETVLYSFDDNGKDGSCPFASLILDAAGNLYGTTAGGGAYGYGTVFELTPSASWSWTETVLHNFNGNGIDGTAPEAAPIFDAAGDLYGTTYQGGAYGYGTVFELTPAADGSWTETVLHSFNLNGTDGYYPLAELTLDAAGNLYGTTYAGGAYNYGTVFELMLTTGGGRREKVLHNFSNSGRDGYQPEAGLIFDASGHLYSTTVYGGAYNYGTVFELTPTAGGGWTEEVLHSFKNGRDGAHPYGGLVLDAGNLYGTASAGGTYSFGAAFELSPTAGGNWTEKVLHNFNVNGRDGSTPLAGLIFDAAGNLYGTTFQGGDYHDGTVFEIKP